MNRRTFLTHATTAVVGSSVISRLQGAPSAAKASPFFSRFPVSTEFEPLVPVVRISTGRDIHRFFDTSPISPSGRYVGLFRLPNEVRPPQPGETGQVVLVDLETGKERVV